MDNTQKRVNNSQFLSRSQAISSPILPAAKSNQGSLKGALGEFLDIKISE